MVHVVFQEADVEVLKQAMGLDPLLEGEVLLIRDDYAVGPIQDLFTEQGIEVRKKWWREVLHGGDLEARVDDGSVDDGAVINLIRSKLQDDAEEKIWIWAAQNGHDVCGYYWLISQLKDYQGRIYILYLNNLPFFNEKGAIFYPDCLSVIPAKEFIKAKKLSRLVTTSEFEIDPDEWQKLSEQGKLVRLLEGGKKLNQQDEDFYDADLIKFITHEWQKASRLISAFFHKSKFSTGDAYLLWRLKQLSSRDDIEIQGSLKGAKEFELKLAGANLPPLS
ncbi:MAG TPA: DUF1835 domain-containing protein [Flavitalea sp.]|nr:DUF1835 domain-containing protein [Flavitalea sp.]